VDLAVSCGPHEDSKGVDEFGATRSNLLSAKRAHRPGGAALENEIQVKVRDDGPGIFRRKSKTNLRRILPAAEIGRGVEGTGLGLAITDSLVKLQGGTLGLESAPGKGSCFYFSLPLGAKFSEPSKSWADGKRENK